MTNKKPFLINLYGGPCSGKSTFASGIFSLLKLHAINCEYVTEFAKDLVWEKRVKTLSNQVYIFGKQYHRIWRLIGEVDIIISDSPLGLSLYYGLKNNISETAKAFFKDQITEFNNLNYFLNRTKKYSSKGRYQTEKEARVIDEEILNILKENKFKFEIISGDHMGLNKITGEILNLLGCEQRFRISPHPYVI